MFSSPPTDFSRSRHRRFFSLSFTAGQRDRKRMLLGKRPRPALSRTKSSAEFPTAVVFDLEAPPPADDAENHGGEDHPPTSNALPHGASESPQPGIVSGVVVEEEEEDAEELAAGTASLLRACGLCERRLGPGRDIYMYRGDIAFCSHECRQQQMNLDEQKKKCSP